MAFAQVQDGDTQSGSNAATTSHTLTYPTNLANGNLIVGFMATDGDVSQTWPAVFVGQRLSVTSALPESRVRCLVGLSDGTETGNFTVTTGASEDGVWRVFRVTGANGEDAGDFSDGTDATGDNTSPDPGSATATWGADDNLWMAVCVTEGDSPTPSVTGAPASYTNLSSDAVGAGGCVLVAGPHQVVADDGKGYAQVVLLFATSA